MGIMETAVLDQVKLKWRYGYNVDGSGSAGLDT